MSTHASLLPARAPRSAFTKLMQSETKMAWRVPIGLILGVAAPVFVLVIFGTIPGLNRPEGKLGGLTYFGVYFPILIAFSVAILALISLPTHLASYREQGILRRLSTTPVPPTWMLAAQVIINLALAVVALGIIAVAGTVGYGLGAPGQPAGFLLSLLLTIAAMFALGLWVSAFARSAAVAGGIGQLVLYPSLFFAGPWLPREVMAPILRDIRRLDTPGRLRSGAAELDAGRIPADSAAAGDGRLCPGVRLPGRTLLPVGVKKVSRRSPARPAARFDHASESRLDRANLRSLMRHRTPLGIGRLGALDRGIAGAEMIT
jgi:ABC-2 type transport system permease protein